MVYTWMSFFHDLMLLSYSLQSLSTEMRVPLTPLLNPSFWNHLKICNPHLFSLLLYRYDLINCKSRHKTSNTLLNTFWLHPDLYISTDVMLWRKLYFCGLQRCKIIPTIKPRTGTVEPHLPFLWETIKLCYT